VPSRILPLLKYEQVFCFRLEEDFDEAMSELLLEIGVFESIEMSKRYSKDYTLVADYDGVEYDMRVYLKELMETDIDPLNHPFFLQKYRSR
jgi:hypothetical protein